MEERPYHSVNFMNSVKVMAVGMPITVMHCTTAATASSIVSSHPNKNSHTCMHTHMPSIIYCQCARAASRPPSSDAGQLVFAYVLLHACQSRISQGKAASFAIQLQDASSSGCLQRSCCLRMHG